MKPLECTFKEFFVVWASLHDWEIPELHFKIVDFLADYESWQRNTAVLQVFRGAAKSTLVGLFVAWQLSQDPTKRFLIISETKNTADKMTQAVIDIINKHPLAVHLRSEDDMWRLDAIKVKGHTDARSPSVTSKGIMSSITGSRADFIIYDDVEGAKNTENARKRNSLRYKLGEPTHILVPGGHELFIGTPHAYESIYPELIGERKSDGEINIYRGDVSSLKIPVLTDVVGQFPEISGTPSWPGRFSVEEVVKRAKTRSKGEFYSQYFLIPYRPESVDLDPERLVFYNDELTFTPAGQALLGTNEIVGATLFWDPAIAKGKSAISLVLAGKYGQQYIHFVTALPGDPPEQCDALIKVAKQFHVGVVTAETNGIGLFITRLFRQRAAGTGVRLVGRATTGKMKKADRIKETLGPRLESGFLYAHTRLRDSKFTSQLRDFVTSDFNDLVDATAMAVDTQPVRLQVNEAGDFKSPWTRAFTSPTTFADDYRPW